MPCSHTSRFDNLRGSDKVSKPKGICEQSLNLVMRVVGNSGTENNAEMHSKMTV